MLFLQLLVASQDIDWENLEEFWEIAINPVADMEIRYDRQGSNTYQHESGPGY